MCAMVWVEQNAKGEAIRILSKANAKLETFRSSETTYYGWDSVEAVCSVRRQIFDRCRGECEICASPVTESSGHMHEQKHRGKGGEISLDNSIFICVQCHKRAHKDRNPRWKLRGVTEPHLRGLP